MCPDTVNSKPDFRSRKLFQSWINSKKEYENCPIRPHVNSKFLKALKLRALV